MSGKNEEKRGILSKTVRKVAGKIERRPAEAPKSTKDIVLTLAEAIRFGYAETLGKWHILDLPRAIFYALTDKEKKTIAMECGERSDCKQLRDPELVKELYEVKKLLSHTMLFSKKRFRSFLFAAGFSQEDVLLRKRRARILKPAFTLIRDKESKCFFVFIRGTRSLKDTLTDAIGAPVSFTHFICSDGELKRTNMVAGHAHRGMVAAAKWIKERCTPKLLDAVRQYPDFKIKIVGHSLGGGTAALLTYMLREIEQFSSCTCVTFGPAASTSLELAEFGWPFIISIINSYDIVPSLSASAVHDFIYEGRVKHKNFLKSARSSITATVSRLPFASTAKAIGSQVVTKHRERTRSLFSRNRRENNDTLSNSKSDNFAEVSLSSEKNCKSLAATEEIIIGSTTDEDESNYSSEGSDMDEEEQTISENKKIPTSTACDVCDEELLKQLEEFDMKKQDHTRNVRVQEREVVTTKNTGKEENQVVHDEENTCQVADSDNSGRHPLYPPGRIMHIVPVPLSGNSDSNHNDPDAKLVYLYETPRKLYGELRFSKKMISDHLTSKYLKMLERAIDQLEKEHFHYGG